MKDYDRLGPEIAEKIGQAARDRLKAADSAKGNRITEALLSGAIDAYKAMSPHANAIHVSAHQNKTHVKEQHPDVVYENRKPDRDITISGGGFELVGELETSGGPKAVISDFKKVENESADKLKYLATRALSAKGQGRYNSLLQRASKRDGGCYIGLELQLAKEQKSSMARITVVCFDGGQRVYHGSFG